jgi:hypothetical protein
MCDLNRGSLHSLSGLLQLPQCSTAFSSRRKQTPKSVLGTDGWAGGVVQRNARAFGLRLKVAPRFGMSLSRLLTVLTSLVAIGTTSSASAAVDVGTSPTPPLTTMIVQPSSDFVQLVGRWRTNEGGNIAHAHTHAHLRNLHSFAHSLL